MSADDPHSERDQPEGRDPSTGGPEAADPSAELNAALRRSREHARAALSEAIACLAALLDAASLATSGVPAEAHALLHRLAATLADAAAGLAPGSETGRELLDALAAALDDEIARWERRADDDPDARSVLRAFLGMRELLWEFGVRRRGGTRSRGPRVARPGKRPQRVQRVPVEGAAQGAGPGA